MDYEALAAEFLKAIRKMKTKKSDVDISQELKGERFIVNFIYDSNDPVSPTAISEATNISSAQVAAVLNNLEKKGIISREKNPDDRRQVIVQITQKGSEFTFNHRKEVLEHTINDLKKLGDDDAREFVRIMKKIVELR